MRPFLVTLVPLVCEDTEKEVETETETVVEEPQDSDMDGFTSDEDCDDMDSAINPGADEVCDGIDNNCDGVVDEDALSTFYVDSDDDGFGDPDIYLEACEAPDRYVANGSDCNDREDAVYPGADEVCDGSTMIATEQSMMTSTSRFMWMLMGMALETPIRPWRPVSYRLG